VGSSQGLTVADLDVVTGAFSYTGRHIAEALLARGRSVRTLTRRPAPAGDTLAEKVETAPFSFDDSLVESLRGADTLYNTYWVRFERGETTFERALANTRTLFDAAREAGIRRVVHISAANAEASSPFPYFRGKAATEEALRDSGLSHAIVRPTLVFGPHDILVNNIAWALRHVPVFLIAGHGRDEVQPVSVFDTARICVEVGASGDDVALDAAGSERFAFEDYVRLIARAAGGRARIRRASPKVVLVTGRIAGLFLRDVTLTRDELGMLRAGLLVSYEPPLGRDSFEAWLTQNGRTLGRHYHSELARHYRR
jgi:nucleoside-diphosphate-sugar epimerase